MDYDELVAQKPSDDEKRMIITLAKRLAKATGKKPREVFDAALSQVKRMQEKA